MKLHYKGKFDLNLESLPHGEHQAGYVPFKEAQDSKSLSIKMNTLAIIMMVVLVAVVVYVSHVMGAEREAIGTALIFGTIFSYVILFPHELLHAICFKEDVYLYTNFKQGMLFVVGPETMSKSRFIFMSLLPNIIFGFIPFLLWAVFFRDVPILGMFGAICISMGCGDYYNIFNAATQMPKGARTYLYGFNSFWYIPANVDN